ncbi:uncharacterized protein LOC111701837 [Eurytemora carolleeae]|uniref:uncharacterized protein LOC111701837 n=1 Tax=Eurytemora carolleeae TaxID=1294199 RepID=UPI000C75FA05|nr:uncharacterized protein LOC111701837 [Eurytemora carolleeae]|eukprot:XP_023329051.1 uncharacterized protein LOC111701837 [Eurytemora affinis]
MKMIIVICCLMGVAMSRPGGYTGIGGVYKNMNQKADYMSHAKKASQMALDLFNDESLTLGEEERSARATSVYVPSFFTSQPQQVAVDPIELAAAAEFPALVRSERAGLAQAQYYELPIYYNEYSSPVQENTYYQ